MGDLGNVFFRVLTKKNTNAGSQTEDNKYKKQWGGGHLYCSTTCALQGGCEIKFMLRIQRVEHSIDAGQNAYLKRARHLNAIIVLITVSN